jgi:hypothetical protein
MLTYFNLYKLNYTKAQIFPFLIALLCVILAMIMITVNLGQVGLMRTDVSNAADAAALSGASVLSGTLLNLGIISDMMCGRAVEAALMIVAVLISGGFPTGTVLAVMMYTSFLVQQWVNFEQAQGTARMGWANAKKTAMQYAFNNVGVDQPRPEFDDFLQKACLDDGKNLAELNDQELTQYNDEYIKGQTKRAREFGRSGFSRFIEDDKKGYWCWGKITPSNNVQQKVTSGFGWDKDDQDSYGDSQRYKNYDNWVEVMISGIRAYQITYWSFLSASTKCLQAMITMGFASIAGVAILIRTMGFFQALNFYILIGAFWLFQTSAAFFPAGLTFKDCNDQYDSAADKYDDCVKPNVDDNPLIVDVNYYKKDSTDMGIWKFQYGIIKAQAKSHNFGETKQESIEPAMGKILDLCAWFNGFAWENNPFDTKLHLFETALMQVY